MQTAPLPAGLSSQTHQGSGARFFHRVGRALRGAISGIARVGQRRPQAKPPSVPTSPDSRDPNSPRRRRAPRRPRPVPPQPARPGRFARWFGLGRRPSPSARRARLADGDTAPYSPETHPGLSPEACAILNTRVEDCDPEILRLIVAGLAVHIAESLQLDDAEAEAMFVTLSQRLSAPLGPTPDAPPPSPMAEPDAPVEPPERPAASTPDSPPPAPAAPPTPPPRRPVRHRSRPLHPGRRRLFRGGPGILPRASRDKQRGLPPPRRCHAARAGPP